MPSTVIVARTLLVVVVMLAGCRCRRDDVTDQPKFKTPAVETEAVKLCLEGVRGLSRYSDRCESSHLWWGSVERAVEQLRPACERLTVAPGARFDRAEIAKCNAALEKTPCYAPPPLECRIGGTLKHGEPCAFGVQCATGLFCKQPENAICGKCEKVAREGDDCREAQCDEGLVCILDKCGPPKSLGTACSSSYECTRPLSCDPTGMVCVAPKKAGEACTGLDCDVGLFCDGVCKPREKPKSPGGNCEDALDCIDFNCVAGRCEALLGVGASCGHEGSPCAPSLMCVRGKCVLPDARDCR